MVEKQKIALHGLRIESVIWAPAEVEGDVLSRLSSLCRRVIFDLLSKMIPPD